MSVTDETFVGPLVGADGRGPGRLRQDKTGALVSNMANGQYYEQSGRGAVYSLQTAVTGATIAAGHVAPPAAAAATLLTLSNPANSGKHFAILKGTIAHISGTAGTGCFSWCIASNTTSVLSATPNATAQCTKSGGSASAGLGYTATTMTGGLVHTITRLFPTAVFATAMDAATQGKVAIDFVDGAITLAPGYLLTIAPAATGSSHVAAVSIEYMEITLPA